MKEKKKLIKRLKNEKGAITVLVIASLLVITVVFINLYMMGSNKANSQNKEIKMIQEAYNCTEDKIDLAYKNSIVFEHVNVANTNPKEALPSNIKEILENDANKGIVIKDKNENEWVWVEVPKTTVFSGLIIDTTKELIEQDYNDIRDRLIEYVGVYRNGSSYQAKEIWEDEWYEGCGLTPEEYTTIYQKMLKGIYKYGGFWIGRYEAGIEGSIEDISKARTSSSSRIEIGTSPKAISQKDAVPYNYIYYEEAQKLAQNMRPDDNYISSLMFGIQWDLVCKFLEMKGGLTTADINSNSGSWGIYNNVERIITSSNAKQERWKTQLWTTIKGTKPASGMLLTTGASDEAKKMNIYDLAGNVWEWTLEKYFKSVNRSIRGGYYDNTSSIYPASCRSITETSFVDSHVGFRAMLYEL